LLVPRGNFAALWLVDERVAEKRRRSGAGATPAALPVVALRTAKTSIVFAFLKLLTRTAERFNTGGMAWHLVRVSSAGDEGSATSNSERNQGRAAPTFVWLDTTDGFQLPAGRHFVAPPWRGGRRERLRGLLLERALRVALSVNGGAGGKSRAAACALAPTQGTAKPGAAVRVYVGPAVPPSTAGTRRETVH